MTSRESIPYPPSRVRVLHIVPALFGDAGIVGGGERYAFELARHMSEHVPTTLLTFGDRETSEQVGPLEVVTLGNSWYVRGQRTNPFHPRLLSHIRRASVVHCHQQHVVASSASAAAGRLLGRPVFVSDLGGGGWDVSAYVSTDRWFSGHLHISHYSLKVKGHDGWGAARVILGGVDTERFSPPPAGSRRNTILFVGRLLPHKGVDYLIEGVPDGIPLEVVGRIMHEDYFERLQSLARGRDVRFFTTSDDDDLVAAYRRAKCVVLPSVYRNSLGGSTTVPELLGQTLLEGMACGAATICTNVASMPEVVDNGVTGLVVPPNDSSAIRDAIGRIFADETRAVEMGRAGRARVLEHFTWGSVVQRCLEAYGLAS